MPPYLHDFTVFHGSRPKIMRGRTIFLTSAANSIQSSGMTDSPSFDPRSSSEVPASRVDRDDQDAVNLDSHREHTTTDLRTMHNAQEIVANVLVKVPAYQRLDDSTFSAICSAAFKAQFGEPGSQDAPPLTGSSQAPWQLIQVAEHLLRRQIEPSVIEAAMKEVLRPA